MAIDSGKVNGTDAAAETFVVTNTAPAGATTNDGNDERIQLSSQLPWDPSKSVFPLRKDLPVLPGAPAGAAWVWGPNDFRGRLNLLTPARIAQAAAECIVTGESARVDLPLDVPRQPSWGRESFRHTIKATQGPTGALGHDDLYCMNTQSGTQWDGFRHVSWGQSGVFYNGTRGADITGPAANGKAGIHHWSQAVPGRLGHGHGPEMSSGVPQAGPAFAGRAILLDYRAYAASQGIHYDAAEAHAITYEALAACGRAQGGLDIRPERLGGDVRVGDILLVRSGFVEDYYARSEADNAAIGLRASPTFVGLGQEPAMVDWLHDCYFAAVAGDAPAFECWSNSAADENGHRLHEHLLALWGVPIGEMLDLEAVSAIARKLGRWTFFFCSAPANCPNGVASAVNGTAIF